MEVMETVQLHESIQEEIINEVIYHCHVCMAVFVNENVFRMHMDNHTAQRPFECTVCGVRFIDEIHLKRHSDLKHVKEDVYEACPICGKLFHDKVNLKSHMTVHSEERPFQCAECGKSFKRKNELEHHTFRHTGDKPHKCSLCNRAFTSKSYLKTHMRVHTGEKPFKCDICGMEFSRISVITHHMKLHNEEKPYNCSECEESFKLKRSLKRHELKVHEKAENKPIVRTVVKKRGRKPSFKKKGKYECSICQKKFDFVSRFNDHIKTHNVDSCYLCGEMLKNKAEKRRHVTRPIKLENGRCYSCTLKFENLEDFKAHMSEHSELCRLEECLKNAENLHSLATRSRSSNVSQKDFRINSEEEDGHLQKISDAHDSEDSEDNDTSPSLIKEKTSDKFFESRVTIDGNSCTVKREVINDDEQETTILELIDGGNGLQLKSQNGTSSPVKKFSINNSANEVTRQSTNKPEGRFKVAMVNSPRIIKSSEVSFKNPIKEKAETLPVPPSLDLENGIHENPLDNYEENEDDSDLAETYCVYVRNMIRLQPVQKQMALIKAINTTIGKFIND